MKNDKALLLNYLKTCMGRIGLTGYASFQMTEWNRKGAIA